MPLTASPPTCAARQQSSRQCRDRRLARPGHPCHDHATRYCVARHGSDGVRIKDWSQSDFPRLRASRSGGSAWFTRPPFNAAALPEYGERGRTGGRRMQPGMAAGAVGLAGIVVGTFLPVAVGLFLLGVGYRRRRWHREGIDTGDAGQWLILAGWVVAGIGLVGLLTVAAASQR
jgi:hypothetical protein